MIIDGIKTKYPKLQYALLSSLIFILIAKSYYYFVYVVNYGLDIPSNVNFIFVWGFRVLILTLVLFIKWNIYDSILLAIGLAVCLLTKNSLFLAFFVMGIYCRRNNISSEYLIKSYLFITAIFFLGIILLNMFKIIPNGSAHYRNDTLRNDFGFGNPNSPFLASLPLYAGYIYLRFDKYDIYDRILLLLASFLIYFQTYSRTGLITILVILVFIEIVKIININNKLINVFLSLLPILMTTFSFFTAQFLNIDLFNEVLSHRPETWNIYMKNIKLFGNNDYYSLRKVYPLDNSYIYSFILYGIIFTVLLLILYTYFMHKNVKLNNYKIIAVSSIFLIYSFGENILFNAALNFTIVLAISSIPIEKLFNKRIR